MEIDELIRRAKAGEQQACQALLQHTRHRLRLLARGTMGESLAARVDSSDLVQDTLVKVHDGFKMFRGNTEGEWLAWVRRIMASEACHLRRHHFAEKRTAFRERTNIEDRLDGQQATPAQLSLDKEQNQLIARAVEELPEPLREVIQRRVYMQESFQDIAGHLNKKTDYVRVLLTRAVRRVAEQLEAESGSLSSM